ncbi:MAG: type II toxin-antitoxin system RatA family toxin [Rhodospirillaceae bacterium]|jgi:coenzyme Q-binding protein COQ10|nr:type II toxin-antitoxin system RatA family toxin [Rhodospirillaceae bacterium]MBT6137748.1 type II toxin-antitoxin system RatA family toxin [Rhodospirillaceae bacterium]
MPTHAEKRVVPFTPQQIYDLVADVDRYPEFLPWCVGARVRKREASLLTADLIIGYKLIRERFSSRVELKPEEMRINVAYMDGPFRYLNNHWIFEPHEEGCVIDFHVDFEFRSRMLQKIIAVLFNEAVRRMVAAFEQRAHDLYDPVSGGAGETA